MPSSPDAYGHHHRSIRARVITEETHCIRCGQPVDRTLPGTHPDGPTADHIVPRAHGGQNTRSNYGLAHLHCNLAHGATTRTTQASSRQW